MSASPYGNDGRSVLSDGFSEAKNVQLHRVVVSLASLTSLKFHRVRQVSAKDHDDQEERCLANAKLCVYFILA